MPYDDILLDAEERMQKSVIFLQGEYKKMRGGRASPGLVENLKVDYYGTPTPLRQIAAIGVPEPLQLVIRPYDPAALDPIQKSILRSDIGITPTSDGKVIRLAIPPLSEERRKQLVAQTKHMAEEARVAIRNVRRDAIRAAEAEEEAGDMTEDDLERFKKDAQDITDEYTKKVSELYEAKAEELMQV